MNTLDDTRRKLVKDRLAFHSEAQQRDIVRSAITQGAGGIPIDFEAARQSELASTRYTPPSKIVLELNRRRNAGLPT